MKFAPELSLVQPAFITNIMIYPFGIVGAFGVYVASAIALRKLLK